MSCSPDEAYQNGRGDAASHRCPFCKGAWRYPYLTSCGRIMLLCRECGAIWLDVYKTGWSDSADHVTLKAHFGIQHRNYLFDSPAHWATKREVANDPAWRRWTQLGRKVNHSVEPDNVPFDLQ